LKHQPFKEASAQTASVTSLYEHKDKRIEKILNSNVQIAGCGNVKLRQLFSPSNRGAVVVIWRRDGSYSINPAEYTDVEAAGSWRELLSLFTSLSRC